MDKTYLKKLLKLEDYVIDDIQFEELRIIVNCHPRKRGMQHKDEYTEALSTTRVKESRHMILDRRVVILRVRQRKFF